VLLIGNCINPGQLTTNETNQDEYVPRVVCSIWINACMQACMYYIKDKSWTCAFTYMWDIHQWMPSTRCWFVMRGCHIWCGCSGVGWRYGRHLQVSTPPQCRLLHALKTTWKSNNIVYTWKTCASWNPSLKILNISWVLCCFEFFPPSKLGLYAAHDPHASHAC
jgi:hypothetical protein